MRTGLFTLSLRGSPTFHDVELLHHAMGTASHHDLPIDASLTRIAIDLEFASPQHLSTLFRKHCGCTPTQWREQHRLTA